MVSGEKNYGEVKTIVGAGEMSQPPPSVQERNWSKLPDHIFEEIMLMSDLESIGICSKVCTSWHEMLMNPRKKFADVIKSRIKNSWVYSDSGIFPSDNEISLAISLETRGIINISYAIKNLVKMVDRRLKLSVLGSNSLNLHHIDTASSLSHHGRLKFVEHLQLEEIDLSKLCSEKLTALVSSVTNYLCIKNIRICDLSPILDSVKCNKLEITKKSLLSEETRALVGAMESRVEEVVIGFCVTLRHGPEDITALTAYSGQGKCGRLSINCDEDTAFEYMDVMNAWARSKSGWKMMRHGGHGGKGLELVRESERESSYDKKLKRVRAKEKESSIKRALGFTRKQCL